jgi:hypothetical protein
MDLSKVKVSIVAILMSIPCLVGGIFWLASVDAKATKGAEAKEMLYKMDKRLDRIEVKLGTKPKNDEE